MFDQILQVVKEQLANNPQLANPIPADKQEAVQQEVATHVNDGLQNPLAAGGIADGLISSLTGKLGLPPAVASAIAAALPGILQKFTGGSGGGSNDTLGGLKNTLGGLFN